MTPEERQDRRDAMSAAWLESARWRIAARDGVPLDLVIGDDELRAALGPAGGIGRKTCARSVTGHTLTEWRTTSPAST